MHVSDDIQGYGKGALEHLHCMPPSLLVFLHTCQFSVKPFAGNGHDNRLTGVGWGGCIVSIVYDDFVKVMLKHVTFLVRSEPSAGAAIYPVNQ